MFVLDLISIQNCQLKEIPLFSSFPSLLAVKMDQPVTNPDASENGISIYLQRLQMCHFVVAARFVKSILDWYHMSGNNRGLLS